MSLPLIQLRGTAADPIARDTCLYNRCSCYPPMANDDATHAHKEVAAMAAEDRRRVEEAWQWSAALDAYEAAHEALLGRLLIGSMGCVLN